MAIDQVSKPEAAGSDTGARHWYVLAVVSIAQLMTMLDVSVVNVALPSAQADLGFGTDARQWVITAYALAFGSLLLLGGRVGDLFGRRRVFLISLVAFAAASALGGAAPSFAVLVIARAIQGVAAAMLAPAALGTLITIYTDDGDRGKVFGVFAAVTMGGGAVGLVLGGVLTEYLSWRWCMYVNVVFAAFAYLGATACLPRVGSAVRARVDIVGAALATLGLFALVFGLARAATDGWSSVITIGSLVIGGVLLACFMLAERMIAQPLLPLRVISERARATAFTTAAIGGIAMFGLFLFLTYYLQLVKGFSPVQSGLVFLPLIVCIAASSNFTNIVLLPRFGPRVVITCGMAVAFLGLAYLTRLHIHSSYATDVLPALIVVGLAQGAVMAPSMNVATAGVQPKDAGVASALVNTMTQVGGSIGTAVMSTIAATATNAYLSSHPHLNAAATTHGYTVVFSAAALVFAAGGVLALAFFPSKARLKAIREAVAEPEKTAAERRSA